MKLTSLIFLTICAGVAHAQSLLVNGNFETTGSSGIPGWTVGGNGNVLDNTTEGSYDGTHAAIFNGGGSSSGNTLSQTFTTVPGTIYIVSFNAAVYGNEGSAQTLTFQVTDSSTGNLYNQTVTLPDPGGFSPLTTSQFGNYQAQFTATGTSTTLTFTDGGGNNSSSDDVLDNVQVVQATTILVNGNFETTGSGVPGWTIGGNGPVGNGTSEGSYDGTHAAFFNPGGSSSGNTLSQTFTTTPGATYTVSFESAVYGNPGATQTMNFQVTSSTGTLVNQTVTPPAPGGFTPLVASQFDGYSAQFTATGLSATLTFTDGGGNNAVADTVIDAVQVVQNTILTNGSFEASGSGVPGWTVGGNGDVGVGTGEGSYDGSEAAIFNGGESSSGNTLSQTFTTTPGITYVVSFYSGVFGTPGGTQSLGFQVKDSTGVSLLNGNSIPPVPNNFVPLTSSQFGYYQGSFTAIGTSTTLTFTDAGGNNGSADVVLDDVQVNASSENIQFPADSGVLNVKTEYGAKGDGVTDDTAAIQSALSAGLDNHKIVYLPNGTYLVSNTLSWQNPAKTSNGGYGRFLSMQGQSRDGTIIKLANNASGYNNPSSRKAVIYTASGDDANQYNGTGEGNQAFENSIQNLTVDIGSGNSGATGVDYQVSNSGAMRNVTIRSSDPGKVGGVGVDMERRDNGPGLIQNVSIDGFQYGIAAGGGADCAYSMEHITLTHQSIMALWIDNAVVAVRDLSTGAAPSAITVYDQGQVSVLSGSFTGGASGTSAVTFSGGGSFGYLRGIATTGYSNVVNNNGTNVSGTSVTEYSANGTVTGLGSSATLQLPIQETPTFYDSNLSHWVSVGAASGSDDTTAIQNAMNATTSTNSTVYFPSGSFNISNTITIPNTVKHIIGCGVQVGTTGSNFSDGRPLFLFSGGASTDSTVFERFFISSGSSQLFQDTSARSLTIREIINVGSESCYNNSSSDGYLFLEDVSLSGVRIQNPQTVWARQLDTEGSSTNDLIYNSGGILWALGNKTENGYTVVDNENGAKTEDFGQLSYTFGVSSTTPNFINNNSSLTMSCAGTGYFSGATYTLLVTDVYSGTTDNIPTAGQPGRTDGGVNVPLFSSTH